MNLRTHKRMRYAQMSFILVNAYWQRVIDGAMKLTPQEEAEAKARDAARWDDLWKDLEKNMAKRTLVEPFIPEPGVVLHAEDVDAAVKDEFLGIAPEPRYTVCKKSTGEIVATDLDLGAAEAMIQKAKAGKKAALVIA